MRAESWLQLGSTAAVVKTFDSYDVYLIVARKLPLQRGMQRTACVLASVFHAASSALSRDALGKPNAAPGGRSTGRAAAPWTAAARGSGKRAAGPWLYGPEPSCCSP